MLADAHEIERAGIFALVLEGVPSDVAQMVTDAVSVPTIGIGAGPGCDGQVLVFHDLLGLSPGPVPRFVRQYEDLHGRAVAAIERFVADVRGGEFPAKNEGYRLPRETAELLRSRLRTGVKR